jgi:glyoxylase-like metal-dependent hydrolase (beta-lactamase superfamily II)
MRLVPFPLLLFAHPAATAAEQPATVAMQAIKVGAHSYYVQGQPGAVSAENQGFMSNAGFVVADEGVLVFDALGTRPLVRRLVEVIRGITDKPIKIVVVSHYHADHYYGLQVFKELGARIWAHERGEDVMRSEGAAARLRQRRQTLAPWIGEDFRIVPADVWLAGDTDFTFGGLHFMLRHVGPAHSAEDMVMLVVEDGVLYAGDLVFAGHLPFVGDADSRLWLASLEKLSRLRPEIMVPGHGPHSMNPAEDLKLTRGYLTYLRTQMGMAVAHFVPFEEAYAKTDWSEFEILPAFADANRGNAYNTYLLMERELLEKR